MTEHLQKQVDSADNFGQYQVCKAFPENKVNWLQALDLSVQFHFLRVKAHFYLSNKLVQLLEPDRITLLAIVCARFPNKEYTFRDLLATFYGQTILML